VHEATDPTFRSVAIGSRPEDQITKLTVRFAKRSALRTGYFNKLLVLTWNSLVSYLRDRQTVEIDFRQEDKYWEDDEGHGGVEETYTVVTVQNTGRRPVVITGVRARLLKRGWMNLHWTPGTQAELSDQQIVTAYAGEEELDINEVAAFEAHRPGGKPFTKMVAPWLTRVRWRFKIFQPK